MPLSIDSFGISDIGLVRERNEDTWSCLEACPFFLLCDGMGGAKGGSLAARETEAIVSELVAGSKIHSTSSVEEASAILEDAILEANSLVYAISCQNTQFRGMGTTVCGLFILENDAVFGHVGDSRIYRLTQGRLERLTRDHSLMGELVAQGHLSRDQERDFVFKNVLTQAVGCHATVSPSIDSCEYIPGDIFLICSDGLTDYVSDSEIAKTLGSGNPIGDVARQLVEQAKDAESKDNITVVVIRTEERDG